MSRVRQGVRLDAGLLDARAHARAGLPVSVLRQVVLAAVAAAGSRAHAHRRAAVPLSGLRQGVRRQVQPARTRADALEREAARLSAVRQGVRAEELPVQTRGVELYEGAEERRPGGEGAGAEGQGGNAGRAVREMCYQTFVYIFVRLLLSGVELSCGNWRAFAAVKMAVLLVAPNLSGIRCHLTTDRRQVLLSADTIRYV